MDGNTANRKFEIFDQAADIDDPAKQQELLDELCGTDIVLRDQVKGLLSHAGKLGSFLEREPRPFTQCTKPSYETSLAVESGKQIGRYVVLETIGQGGMGSVYLARQAEPVKRRVALKLIKSNIKATEIIGRFEAERQALAMMEHPGIARFFDAGSTPENDPYFVMEYVPGSPVTNFCDEHRFSIRQRLDLFRSICQAVQHAHQKGIIHRDLKPSNILVTMVDDKPVPKIIDFGLAKATGGQLADTTGHTHFGQVLGTLQYMSPEQTLGNPAEVDTRSDIYSLGAILYELLVGSPPFEKSSFKDRPIDEVVRMIREEDPQSPTRRFDSCETNDEIARKRQLDPTKLFRTVRGDLEWIVIKALEKDRVRRYQTANEFSDDILNYLEDRPCKAGSPSFGHYVSKFLKRNRIAVAFASTVAIGLVGLVTTLAIANNLLAERAESERQLKQTAQDRLGELEKAYHIMGDIFVDLNLKDGQPDGDILQSALVERLLGASEQLRSRSLNDPLIAAEIQTKLANSLLSLGHYDEALLLHKQAYQNRDQELGADSHLTITSLSNIGAALSMAGLRREAKEYLEKALGARIRELGLDHPDTQSVRSNLAGVYAALGRFQLAVEMYEKVLEIENEKLGPEDRETLTTMSNLSGAYIHIGEFDKAISLAEQTVKAHETVFGLKDYGTLMSMTTLAYAFSRSGRATAAIDLYEQVYDLMVENFGADHPHSKQCKVRLADAWVHAQQPKKAISIYEEYLSNLSEDFDGNDLLTLNVTRSLGSAYRLIRDYDQAIDIQQKAVPRLKKHLGIEHQETQAGMLCLALSLRDSNQSEKSLAIFQELIDVQQNLRKDNPVRLKTMDAAAVAFWKAKQLDSSIPLLEKVLFQYKKQKGINSPDTIRTMANLAVNYKDNGQVDKAIPLFEEAREALKNHSRHKWATDQLFNAYIEASEDDKAELLALETISDLRENDDRNLIFELVNKAASLIRLGKNGTAEKFLKEALEIKQQEQRASWDLFHIRSLLGESLLGQQRYIEAEKELLAGWQGLDQRKDDIPWNQRKLLGSSIARLIELYESWQSFDPDVVDDSKIVEWKDERTQFDAWLSAGRNEMGRQGNNE